MSYTKLCIYRNLRFSPVKLLLVSYNELNVLQIRMLHRSPLYQLYFKKCKSKWKWDNLSCSLKHVRSYCTNEGNLNPKYSKDGSGKVSEHHEENELGLEAPLVHYASKNVMFDLPDAFIKKKPSRQPHLDNLESLVNEGNLLKDSHKALSSVEKDKGDLEYVEEIGKDTTSAKPLHIQIPVNPLQWQSQKVNHRDLPKLYADLAKSRLTGLVVLTAMAGYAIAPAAFDSSTFLLCSLGTMLVSCSANSINQFLEVPFDSQMSRTRNRVLVRGLLTPLHAVLFGLTCGASGIAVLFFGVNGLTAALGFTNLLLYTSVYTPLKRVSISNTWLGAVVGAIPPLMGWTGCTGILNAEALIMAGILYAWQFPHFNALSWNLRQDYSKAGYRMMAVTDPDLCRRTSLRYCASIVLLSTLAPLCDVTTWTFAVDSLPFNLYFTYLAWRFYKDADSKSSRKLFRFSLLHLPAILILMIISKKTHSQREETKKIL
ncbi:UNVERIFIED_CONTAM: hypothetical protein GTU68_001257 [Idotea baltica]|nr:hypothetical protein [Idotea baltica]